MTLGELEELERLEAAATKGPWFPCKFDDLSAMSSRGVSTRPLGPEEGGAGDWKKGLGASLIAATYMQAAPYVIDAHNTDDEVEVNYRLIAAMRSSLPDLISLAKKGLAVESE